MRLIRKHLHNAIIPHEGNNYIPHLLRHKVLAAIAALAITAKIGVMLLVVLTPGIVYPSSVTNQNIVSMTNQQRTSSGLSQLTSNTKLNQAAAAKAQDMLAKQYFSHYSPSNVSPWHWFKQAGYQYAHAGENLAMDFVTAEGVVDAWMASASHRGNIMNGNFKEIGVSVLEGDFQGAKTILVVQLFGAPAPTPTVAAATTVEKVVEQKPAQPTVTQEAKKELPKVEPEKTVVIPSPVKDNTYDIRVTVKEEPTEKPQEEPIKVAVKQGDNSSELTKTGNEYSGTFEEDTNTPDTNITVLIQDQDKNVVSESVAKTDYFKTSILRPDKFWDTEKLVQLIFYSRNFFLALLIFMSLVLILNVLIKVQVNRRPSVLYSLLVIYLLGVIVIV